MRPERVGRIALAATVVFSVLAMGSFEAIPLVVCSALASIAVIASSWEPTEYVPRRAAKILVWVAIALSVWTLAQCIPMPAKVVAVLSPHASDVWARALRPLGEAGPSWHPLSVDPTATRMELLKGVTYLCVLVAALRVVRAPDGSIFVERVLVVAGATVMVAAMAHEAVGATKVYGFYQPRTGVSLIAPLMNSNHLAAYLNVTLLLCFAGSFSSTPISRRPLLIAMAVILAATEVWIASRGAVGALLLGIPAVVALVRMSKTGRMRSANWIPLLAGAVGVALIVAGLSESALRELNDRDVSKVGVALGALRSMVPSYPLFGVGRGAFESAFPEFRPDGTYSVFSHPENILTQWLVEWGLPVAVAGFGLIAFALRPREVLGRSRPAIGAWAAIMVVGLQNLVDFNSESPAVVIALTCCTALVVGGQGGKTSRSPTAWERASRTTAITLAAVTTLASIVVFLGRRDELVTARELMGRKAADMPPSVHDDDLRKAMLDHPAEPYFPYVGAFAEASRDGARVPIWAGRVFERSPHHGPTHLVLARWLRTRSRAQSRLEYRLAQQDGFVGALPATELSTMVATYEDAIELAPEGSLGVSILDQLAVTVEATLPATAERIDVEILRRDQHHASALLRQARRAVRDAESPADAPWCAVSDCPAEATSAVDRAVAADPTRCAPVALRARLQYARGDAAGSIHGLLTATDTIIDPLECYAALAELAGAAKDDAVAALAIDRLVKSECADESACVTNLLRAASLEEGRGKSNRALVFLRRAVETAPQRDDVVERLAQSASRAGLHSEARSCYAKLVARHPGDARLAAALANETAASMP